jgi:hypothetical protein
MQLNTGQPSLATRADLCAIFEARAFLLSLTTSSGRLTKHFLGHQEHWVYQPLKLLIQKPTPELPLVMSATSVAPPLSPANKDQLFRLPRACLLASQVTHHQWQLSTWPAYLVG